MSLIQQVEEGGVRRPTLEIQAQRLVQLLPVAFGKSLQITGAPAATQDPKDRQEQQELLGLAPPTAVATIGDGLEEADQIIGISLIDCSIWDLGHGGEPITPTKANAARPNKPIVVTLLGVPELGPESESGRFISTQLECAVVLRTSMLHLLLRITPRARSSQRRFGSIQSVDGQGPVFGPSR